MKSLLLALLCAMSISACAQSQPADSGKAAAPEISRPVDVSKETMVRAALKRINPKIAPDRIAPAPIQGFQEAIVAGQVVYISDDGRYMLQGPLFDIEASKDLSQIGLSVLRREALSKIPATDRIVFAPVGVIKHTVAVFTDIECGYCRKLHSEIANYNKLGIAVEYLALPRAGLGTPDALLMESVWCSNDRRKAITDAKNGRPVAPKQCRNPVAAQYEIAQRLGMGGTPMILSADGTLFPGYLPPDKLLETLDKLAAQASADKAEVTNEATKATAAGSR